MKEAKIIQAHRRAVREIAQADYDELKKWKILEHGGKNIILKKFREEDFKK